jgi:glutathione S-transferase
MHLRFERASASGPRSLAVLGLLWLCAGVPARATRPQTHKANTERKFFLLALQSKEFQELYASINPDPSAPAKVPILVDGDVKIIESAIVCEYLASKYADQGEQLMPSDPVAAAKASHLWLGLWVKGSMVG